MLNELVDIVEKEHQAAKDPLGASPPDKIANGVKTPQANGVKKEPLVTWVHENFQVSCIWKFAFGDHLNLLL